MSGSPTLRDACRAGGAVRMWIRILQDTLPKAHGMLPSASRVLEVGYGDGILSCYLASALGWNLLGLDSDPQAFAMAQANARRWGLERSIEFRLVKPEETWSFKGQFDGVFIKTVLYNASTLEQYASWLDWVVSVLKPGGAFVNFENGKANRLTYWYRRLRRRYYADLCMFDHHIARLYTERFPHLSFHYYGWISQFLAPIPLLYQGIAALEESWMQRNADNSYVAAVLARSAVR